MTQIRIESRPASPPRTLGDLKPGDFFYPSAQVGWANFKFNPGDLCLVVDFENNPDLEPPYGRVFNLTRKRSRKFVLSLSVTYVPRVSIKPEILQSSTVEER